MNRQTATGGWVLLALAAASLEPVIVKLGYETGVSPLQLLVLRNLFAAATIFVLTCLWQRQPPQWPGWEKLRLIAGVAILLLATNGLVLFALRQMTAITVVTIVTTTPAFVAIVNQWRGRDILGRKFWLGFAACFCGVLLSVGAFAPSRHGIDPLGFCALALAVGSSTWYRTRMESLTTQVEPRQISQFIFLINAAISGLVIWPWLPVIPLQAIPSSAWIGIAAAVANLAFLSAIKVVGATRMSIFDMLQRPMVIVAAAIVLSEPLTILQGIGVALVLLGVQIAKVRRKA